MKIYIEIKPSTYRGLHKVAKMKGMSEKKFADKALRTYIEDTYDAIIGEKAWEECVKNGEKPLTTEEMFARFNDGK